MPMSDTITEAVNILDHAASIEKQHSLTDSHDCDSAFSVIRVFRQANPGVRTADKEPASEWSASRGLDH